MVPFPFARFDGAARRDQVRLRFVHCGHQGIDVFELNAAERNGRPRRYLSRYVYACPCSGLRPAAPAPGCSPCHGWPAPVVACVAGARWVRRAGAGRRAGDKCARVVTRRVLQSRCAHARLRRGGVARAYAVRYIYAVITSLLVGHQGAEAKGKAKSCSHHCKTWQRADYFIRRNERNVTSNLKHTQPSGTRIHVYMSPICIALRIIPSEEGRGGRGEGGGKSSTARRTRLSASVSRGACRPSNSSRTIESPRGACRMIRRTVARASAKTWRLSR